jgi:RimJ/RimL family protein N-acetyltransferase
MHVTLREVLDTDFPIFFTHQLDRDANWMAAFTAIDPTDRAAYDERWERLRKDDKIFMRTVLGDGDVVGSILAYGEPGIREISYWIGRQFWGHGIATKAARLFIKEVEDRPLYARVAKDNLGSMRVLEKCGFVIVMGDKAFAHARNRMTEEWVMRLE